MSNNSNSENANNILYIDALFCMLFGMLFMVVCLMASVQKKAEEAASAEPPGQMAATITWPEGDTDVDLWLLGPGEPAPIGYSNKAGNVWNLLRDDLGNGADAMKLNFENAYTRGIVPGQYVINVHCYRCNKLPVAVQVEIAINTGMLTGGKSGSKVLATTTVNLKEDGKEATAIRFTLDAKGNIVPGSSNAVFKALRNGFVR